MLSKLSLYFKIFRVIKELLNQRKEYEKRNFGTPAFEHNGDIRIPAIDDDGDVKDCLEMVEAQGLIIVLEQDDDGDVNLTLLDPAASYITNA